MSILYSADEIERLRALHQYAILDTPPEEQYDDITELAAALSDAPIALVTLVDENRQWFKSRVGLTIVETHRKLSFCSHTIQQRAPMIVHDALCDERFTDNDLVTGEPHIRFYAGFPLMNSDGHALGTLCAIDTKPRDLTPAQFQAMKVLSDRVLAELELRRALHSLTQSFEQLSAREETIRTLKTAILDASLDGIITLDDNEIIREWNPAAEKILGCARDEAIGCALSDVVAIESEEAGGKVDVARIAGREQNSARGARIEATATGRDRRTFPAELSAIAVPLDGRLLYTVFLRDITQRKQVEAENARLLAKTQTDAEWQWTFLRDVLQGVTDGKLRLVKDRSELPMRPPEFSSITRETLSAIRRQAVAAARALDFPQDRIDDLATAVSETAMNAIVHARDGQASIAALDDDVVQVWIEDRGPGIHLSHLPRAMLKKGYTTAGTFGHGLKLTLQTADRVWLLTNASGATIVLEKDRAERVPEWLSAP